MNIWETHSSAVLSITLVMFLLGMCFLLEYHSYRLTHDMQERITFKVDLVPDISDEMADLLKMKIETMPEVKHVDYISRQQAAEIFSEELNDDFVSFCGYNPLYPSMMVNLKASYLPEMREAGRSEVIATFASTVGAMDNVTGVVYQENVVNELNHVFYNITWFLVIFIVLLLVISVLIISSTIRISLYAQRETVSTMLLVGAKKGFIARPFLVRGIWYGMLGALIALAVLAVSMGVLNQSLVGLDLLNTGHFLWYGAISIILIVLGVVLSMLSTRFAVYRYLRYNN